MPIRCPWPSMLSLILGSTLGCRFIDEVRLRSRLACIGLADTIEQPFSSLILLSPIHKRPGL